MQRGSPGAGRFGGSRVSDEPTSINWNIDEIELRRAPAVPLRDAGGAAARGRRSRLLKWVERLFLIAGATALVWCAAILTDAYLIQHIARKRLESMSKTGSSTAPFTHPILAPGAPVADLSIPRIGLSAIVLQGSDDHTLSLGPGHFETTPLPGEPGNVVIAGHRDTFFRPLQNVQVGDDIILTAFGRHVHYRVLWFSIVDPGEVSVIGPTSDAVLTLVTCYPFHFIGPAPDRFIVRSIRVEDPGG
jgi:sortase A